MYDDLIGVPFENGGRGPGSFDCWGLVMEVFQRHDVLLPDYKIACTDASRIDSQISERRPLWEKVTGEPPVPSLVVIRFNSVVMCNHTGVYLGNGMFIHAREKIGVNIDRIDSPAWNRRIEGFYVPGEGALT